MNRNLRDAPYHRRPMTAVVKQELDSLLSPHTTDEADELMSPTETARRYTTGKRIKDVIARIPPSAEAYGAGNVPVFPISNIFPQASPDDQRPTAA